jgi:predicted pyridoxine 5'-phosphate oxidase superfamily flavin-nucleotide-binding protein
MSIYDDHHRALQDRFESRPLADALEFAIVSPTLDDDAIAFVESREFFFLSTVRADGQPTVSHKGGPPGVVRAVDPGTLVFPSYDGNGMFLSMGNLAATARIGMLFIDFEKPHRVRVHADAELVGDDDPILATLADRGIAFPGAQLLVKATITESFVNCPRYIVKHRRVAASPYVPDAEGDAPVPDWKKTDGIRPFLTPADQERVAAEGETISMDEYNDRVRRGDA